MVGVSKIIDWEYRSYMSLCLLAGSESDENSFAT